MVAAWFDWQYRRIPNVVLFSAMIIGVSYNFITGEGSLALGGMALAFVITFVPVALRGMGMGDQKLLMAVGAWTGAGEMYQLFLLSLLFCLLVIMMKPRKWWMTYLNLRALVVGWIAHKEIWLPSKQNSALTIPYAVCLFAAHLTVLWGG